MAQQDGFTGGLQFGLSVFNALQNASYLQSQQQAMQENQQMRREELATDQARLEESKRQHEFQKTQLVLEHPDKFPQETVLASYNTMNQLSGGKHTITKTDLDTFSTDMTKMIGDVKNAPNVDAGNLTIERYRERAATHPLFMNIFNRNLPIAQDMVKRRGLYTAFEAAGITDDRIRTRLSEDLTTDQAQDLLKDEKRMDLLRHRQMQEIEYRFQTQPDKVSDADLMTLVGTRRALGQKPTDEGEKLLLPRDKAQFYQETVSDLNQTKRDLNPLLEAEAAMSDVDKAALFEAKNEIKTFAGTYPGSSMAANDFTLGKVKHENDAVNAQQQILAKYPQLTQTLKQVGPTAIAKVEQYDDQIAQWERQKRLVKLQAGPETPLHLERIDEKLTALKMQSQPYRAIANWHRNPESPEALKGVFNLKRDINKALENGEARQQEFMTEAERNSKQVRTEQATKLHVDTIGPAEVEYQTMQWLAENPNATDQQIMGKAAEFGGQYKQRTGYMPNLKEATTRLVAQRTSTEETLPKLTPEQGVQFQNILTGQTAAQNVETMLIKNGEVDYKLLTQAWAGVPWTHGRTLDTYIRQALDPIQRQRTGANITDKEWPLFEAQFVPKPTDSQETIHAKLDALQQQFSGAIDLVDPQGKLRSRVKPSNATAANPPAERSFDEFKSWYQQNKGKFASPEEAAQAFRRGG